MTDFKDVANVHLSKKIQVDAVTTTMQELKIIPKPEPNSTKKGDDDKDYLFDASTWISGSGVQEVLPENYVVRPLRLSDYHRGFLDCLAQLTKVGEITFEQFAERFNFMKSRPGDYFPIVIEDRTKGLVVASATILIERKFIRQCGIVGHIEDVVVHESQRGHNLGRRIIDQLTFIGKANGCYKIILCCADRNVGFYEKCGYERKEAEMALYFNK